MKVWRHVDEKVWRRGGVDAPSRDGAKVRRCVDAEVSSPTYLPGGWQQ